MPTAVGSVAPEPAFRHVLMRYEHNIREVVPKHGHGDEGRARPRERYAAVVRQAVLPEGVERKVQESGADVKTKGIIPHVYAAHPECNKGPKEETTVVIKAVGW